MNSSLGFELELRDGTPVLVRRLVGDDRQALAEAYRRLSSKARYHRFWTWTGEVLSGRILDRVLEDNPLWHSSWAVLDMEREFPGLGAASWWRDKLVPKEAEFSATVLDSEHGRGIGTLLLAVIWLSACRQGIEVLKGYAMPENRQASAWMRACGASGEWDGHQLVFRWDLLVGRGFSEFGAGRELEEWLERLGPAFEEG